MKEYHQIEDLPIALQNEIKDNASFFDNFDGKSLDEQQRIACVLNDCDLEIIAGAGTGKTHTLLAKAAYLIEKKNVAPDDILFLSFSKSCVEELIERLNYDVPTSTIHAFGLSLVDEYRSVCTQPIKDSLSVAAFHVGLKEKLDELEELISHDKVIYHKGYTAGELRKLLIQDELPAFIDKNDLCKLSMDIVDLANIGLEERGFGEEIFLNPLYERIKQHSNPGKDIITLMNNGTKLEKIIKDYGELY